MTKTFKPDSRRVSSPLGVLLVITTMMLAACSGGSSSETSENPTTSPATGGEVDATASGDDDPSGALRVAAVPPTTEATFIDQTSQAHLWHLRGPVFETLVGYDSATGDQYPLLAESWESNDDLTEWTFQLREGVQFHRGAGEMTSEDVAFSMEVIMAEESLSTDAAEYRDKVERIETPDPYTVEFYLNTPMLLSARMSLLDSSLLITSKTYYDDVGAEEAESTPVGTGPYEFENWTPNQGMTYTSFADYWGERSDFAELEIRFVGESQTRLNMLLAGEVDLIDLPRELHADAEGAGMVVKGTETPGASPVLWFGNLYLPDTGGMPWSDVRVREALKIAIDKQAIVDGVLAGFGDPDVIIHVLGPQSQGIELVEREPAEFDPERARELLEEAGYSDGLSLDIKVPEVAGVPEIQSIIEAVASNWADIGVDASIQRVEAITLQEAYRARADMPFIFPTRFVPRVQPLPFEFLGFYDANDGFIGGVGDEEVQRLIDELPSVPPDEWAEHFAEITHEIVDKHLEIPLPAVFPVVAFNPEVVADWTGTMKFGFDGIVTAEKAE